jgi:hypothetical protein
MLIMAIIAVTITSCKDECMDRVTLRKLEEDHRGYAEQLDGLYHERAKIDSVANYEDYAVATEEIVDIEVLKTVNEIDQEILKRDSECL